MRWRISYLVALAAAVVGPGPTEAKTWIIQPDGLGHAPTVQAGVDSAAAGDSLLLTPGTFTGPGNRGIDFAGKAIVLTSQAGPSLTIIDCEGQDRGFNFQSGETPVTVLSGVTIVNGDAGKSAGGIFCSASSPSIENCVLRDNAADGGRAGGGALFCVDFADPVVTATRFSNNQASNGGAVWCGNGSRPIFSDCVFENNMVAQNGGAFACVSFGRPSVINCTIANNVAANFGSAMYASNASPLFIQTIVTSTVPSSLIYCDVGAAPTFTCCNIFGQVVGGYAPDLGGGNSFEDPRFCGIDGSGNYFLRTDSPCTADNSPCAALIGALPIGCGTTPTDSRTWGGIKRVYR